jgi:hypothetical protein
MRGATYDIATSRAFIPPWSLADALRTTKVGGKTGLLSDQASHRHDATGTLAILKMMQIASHLSRANKARIVPTRSGRTAK